MKDWGIELQRKRMAAGWTQEQLANAIGVSAQSVSFWETGRRSMTLRHAESAFGLFGNEFVLKRKVHHDNR